VLAAPLAGQAIGAINGVLAAYTRLPSFLITLGMLFAVNGMTLYLTQVTAIGVEPDLRIQSVFNGFLFGAPTIALWALTAWLLSVSAEYQAALARPHIVGGDTIDLPECEDARKVIRMLSQQSSRRLHTRSFALPRVALARPWPILAGRCYNALRFVLRRIICGIRARQLSSGASLVRRVTVSAKRMIAP
jgi:hypothetical protein